MLHIDLLSCHQGEGERKLKKKKLMTTNHRKLVSSQKWREGARNDVLGIGHLAQHSAALQRRSTEDAFEREIHMGSCSNFYLQ